MITSHLRLNTFSNRTDLIDLQKQTVTRLFVNGSLDSLRVGHSQIITTNKIQITPSLGGYKAPTHPTN